MQMTDKRRCEYCAYWTGEECYNCQFEYNEYYLKDDWDILHLDENEGWEHLQILARLHAVGIDCIFADIWTSNNFGFLIGCNQTSDYKIAKALGMHEEAIYNDWEHSIVYLNLFQEKYIRGELENED